MYTFILVPELTTKSRNYSGQLDKYSKRLAHEVR